MLKPTFYALVILLSAAVSPVSADEKVRITTYPTFEEIVTRYTELYSTEVAPDESLQFSKNPKGWSVYITKYPEKRIIMEEVFWSSKKEKYQELSFPGKRSGSNPEDFIQDQSRSKYHYNRCLYYGYDGWDLDVIEALENKNLPNDTLTESLARAYSSYANGYLGDQYEFHTKGNHRQLLAITEDYPEERLQLFVTYAWKSIRTFQLLAEKNPGYQTIVGNAWQKYSNEYMWAYTSLIFSGRPDLAKQFQKKDIYTDLTTIIAKNYLTPLPAHAIFVSGGDNDFYPLLWLQMTESFRTDVSVVNYSLMMNQRYRKYLVQKDTSLNTLFRDKAYAPGTEDFYLRVQKAADKTDSLSLMEFVRSIDPAANKKEQTIDRPFVYFQPTGQGRAIASSSTDPAVPRVEVNQQISLQPGYLFWNDLLLMDLVATNHPNRKICWSFYTGPQSRALFANQLINKTTYYTLPTTSNILNSKKIEGLEGYIDPIESYVFLTKGLQGYNTRTKLAKEDNSDVSIYGNAYTILMLCEYFAKENDIQRFTDLSRIYMLKMPMEKRESLYLLDISMTALLLEHNLEDEAAIVARRAFDHYKEVYTRAGVLPQSIFADGNEKEAALYYLNMLHTSLERKKRHNKILVSIQKELTAVLGKD